MHSALFWPQRFGEATNITWVCPFNCIVLTTLRVPKLAKSKSLILLFPQENRTFGISGINLCHFGAELSILRCRKRFRGQLPLIFFFYWAFLGLFGDMWRPFTTLNVVRTMQLKGLVTPVCTCSDNPYLHFSSYSHAWIILGINPPSLLDEFLALCAFEQLIMRAYLINFSWLNFCYVTERILFSKTLKVCHHWMLPPRLR
jgi:hypothetical protein